MTYSQAAMLPFLKRLPGLQRTELLKLLGDKNFRAQEVAERWKTNGAFIAEIDKVQVTAHA